MANIRLNKRIKTHTHTHIYMHPVYMVLILQNLTVYVVMWVYITLEEQPWE
jgi:hypothetical protein